MSDKKNPTADPAVEEAPEPTQAEKDEAVRQKAKASASDLRAGIVR